MKNSVRRWVYIINVLRALPYVDMDGESLEIEGCKLNVSYDNDGCCMVIDHSTGEIHAIFDEDGSHLYLSDWAQAPVQWEQYDYPMYE